MKNLVFLLEEISAKDLLRGLIPRIVPSCVVLRRLNHATNRHARFSPSRARASEESGPALCRAFSAVREQIQTLGQGPLGRWIRARQLGVQCADGVDVCSPRAWGAS